MNRTMYRDGLLAISGFLASQSALAVTQDRVQTQTGANLCALSVPTIDTKVRPRASGFKNEGATNAFVICSFDAPPGADTVRGQPFNHAGLFTEVDLFLLSTDDVPRNVQCTGVNSLPTSGQQFVTKTVSVASSSVNAEVSFTPVDFNAASYIPWSGGAFSITCLLPPNISISFGNAYSQEDVGD